MDLINHLLKTNDTNRGIPNFFCILMFSCNMYTRSFTVISEYYCIMGGALLDN